MKLQRQNGQEERRILTALVVHRGVLAHVAPKWQPDGLFRSKWANLVGGWCVDFFNEYGEAPQAALEGIFESWADGKDAETTSLVDRFLAGLSDQYEAEAAAVNQDYTVDAAAAYFHRVQLERLAEGVQAALDVGQVDKADKLASNFNKVDFAPGAEVRVLADMEAVRSAFEAAEEVLVEYPGPLGAFFGPQLCRDSFISFIAPEKRGKTWWLQDIAWMALGQRRRVAFFEVGDMSQNQIMRRFMIRAANRPLRPCTLQVPNAIYPPAAENAPAEVTYDERTWDDSLTWQTAWAACEKRMRTGRGDGLRLVCRPTSTLTVGGMRSILEGWQQRDGWTPDVLVVDYADILAPPSGVADTRDQINATWKQLRALSQEFHCCLVTATQADAASYTQARITRSNFSEDKRKLAHVTGMVGINATDEEKKAGLVRLNWVVLREGEFSENQCVHVAGCLGIARPAMFSIF